MPSQIQIQRVNAKLKKRAMQKCKFKFNFPEAAVRKTERSQGEIETEFPQFFNTQDSRQVQMKLKTRKLRGREFNSPSPRLRNSKQLKTKSSPKTTQPN